MASNTQHHELALPRLDAPVRLLAVVAPYYKDITDGLLSGVRATAVGISSAPGTSITSRLAPAASAVARTPDSRPSVMSL